MSDDQPPWPPTPISPETQQILDDLKAKQAAVTTAAEAQEYHDIHLGCCEVWEAQLVDILRRVLAAVGARSYLVEEYQAVALREHFTDIAADLTQAVQLALLGAGALGLEDRARCVQQEEEPPADPDPLPLPPIPVPGDGNYN